MSRPQYKLSGFQFTGNEDGKAIAIITIVIDGHEQTFTRTLNWSSDHDISFMRQLDQYILNAVFINDNEG